MVELEEPIHSSAVAMSLSFIAWPNLVFVGQLMYVNGNNSIPIAAVSRASIEKRAGNTRNTQDIALLEKKEGMSQTPRKGRSVP